LEHLHFDDAEEEKQEIEEVAEDLKELNTLTSYS
jgi:hypothetical protein